MPEQNERNGKIMNILVTGGNGFAGGFISEFLTKLGYDVTATYRHTCPSDRSGKIKYVHQELSDNIRIDQKFDAIVHTACSRSGNVLKIEEYVRDNVDTAREVVNFARRNNIGTIIYFSTRNVYGDIHTLEVDESTDIINPSKYGLTKYIAELIFQEATDLNTIGFRTPGIIGPGAHDIWLVEIVDKIMQGQDVKISDFETKNLVHICDISKFINKLIVSSVNGEAFQHKIVNLSCDELISNIEIANIIKHRLNSCSNIRIKEPEGLFRLNSDRAKEMGFESSSPRDIVNYYLDYVCKKDDKFSKL